MSLGSSGNATIRRPRGGSLRCGVYRVGIVAVDTSLPCWCQEWCGGVFRLTNERDFPVPRLRRKPRSATSAMMGFSELSSRPRKGKSMSIITVGIDLAKNVFAVHGVDDNGIARAGQAEGGAGGTAAAYRANPALPDRHGSLLRRAPLGTIVPSTRAHGQADRPEIRHPVSHVRPARQERRGRRRRHLRSRHPARTCASCR